VNAFEAALYARLTGASALTALLASPTSVYNETAPQENSPLDYVVFALSAGGPTNRSPRRAEVLVYLVQGLSVVGRKRAGEIDDAIDAVLHDAPLTVSGYTNYWLMRETRVRYLETTPAGRSVYHAGGLYRARLGT
jgi:hypothetical protein